MTLSHLTSYDRSGSPALLNGARSTGPPAQAQGALSAEEDAPVGPPGALASQTIDVRPAEAGPPPAREPVRQDFNTLVDAVNQGNLSDARTALESLQGHSPGLYDRTARPATAGSPFSNELDGLMKALKSGDEAGSRSALARLQKEMQAAEERDRAEQNPMKGGLTAIGQAGRQDGVGDSDRAANSERELKPE